jgi:chromosomal replication initiator protein
MINLENIWKETLNLIETKISPMTFETWFMESSLYALNDTSAKIKVPTIPQKKYLKENYYDLISECFSEITSSNFLLEFVCETELDNDIEINTDLLGVPANNFISNLKQQYTFENFVVGKTNKFAKVSAFAVAEKPGLVYNPLFLYGNSGLGKTHLMHAIGNYIVQNSKKNVLYITSDDFVNDFVELHRNNKENNINDVTNFKKKYRDVDVLMVDDIQYLQVADKSQEAFFHTFNDLYGNNKQIIITSDRTPDDLKKLEDRLKTRFNWGLTANIDPPDFDLRLQIIDKKIESNFMSDDFSKEVREYIASNCSSDIRKLEGAITRVTAYAATMNEKKIDLNIAIEALKDFFSKSIISKNSIDKITDTVALHYNITTEDLKSKKRNSKYNGPRQIAMYLCRLLINETYPKIGVAFGGKSHSTVMHSIDKIKNEINNNASLKKEIDKIIDKLS